MKEGIHGAKKNKVMMDLLRGEEKKKLSAKYIASDKNAELLQ
jgi:hypothetical protein